MRFRFSALALAALLTGAALPAAAHDMWVNARANVHDGGAVIVTSMGWGHDPLPIDEFMPGARIGAYRVIGPDGSVLPLPFDPDANADLAVATEGLPGMMRLQAGDAFVRRLQLTAEAPAGGYRVHAASPARVFTTYVDADGNRRSVALFADEIAGARSIVSSAVSVREATAWWTVGDWAAPRPAGAVIELMPLADPAALRAGDSLPVRVLFRGEPVVAAMMPMFMAFGDGPVEPLVAEGADGTATFTLPNPGHFILRAVIELPTADAGAEFAAMVGRVDTIRFIATLATYVGPGAES